MRKSVCLIVLNDFTNDARVLKEAQSLARNGYATQVLAMHAPGLAQREINGDVSIRRIKLLTKSRPSRNLLHLVTYVHFMFKAVAHCLKFDVLHCNDIEALPIGVVSKCIRLGHQKIVYDAHEFEIDREWMRSRRTTRIYSHIEGCLLRFTNAIVTVSQPIAKAYRRIYRIDMPALVLNCPENQKLPANSDIFRDEFGIRADQTIFLYQGGMSSGRGIELLLKTFSERSNDDAVIVFMGNGVLAQNAIGASRKHGNIFYKEAVPPNILLGYTASADVGLVPYEKTCLNHKWCLPNKLFEYIMAGLPVLCADLVEPRRIIHQFGIGETVEWTQDELENGIDRMLDCNRNGLEEKISQAKKAYCWEGQERTLLNVYSELYAQE